MGLKAAGPLVKWHCVAFGWNAFLLVLKLLGRPCLMIIAGFKADEHSFLKGLSRETVTWCTVLGRDASATRFLLVPF